MIQLTPGEKWFEEHKRRWEDTIKPIFNAREYCRALEIGIWEGGSACWILNELCGGDNEMNELVCIDHFDLMKTDAGRSRWETFQENLSLTGLSDRVRTIPEFSTPALFKLMYEMGNQNQTGFNFVYIDGSHRSDDTLLDAEMAWRMASKSCVLVFDDYEWNQAKENTIEHPKAGIDAFLTTHRDEYRMLYKGYQIIIQKEVPMRLGFLLSDINTNEV